MLGIGKARLSTSLLRSVVVAALAWTALLTAACSPARNSRAESLVSTVVLVVVDTLRADHLTVYGYGRPTSPALERAARQGAVFERALSTSSWTLPAFGSIHTGRWPSRHAAGTPVEDEEFGGLTWLALDDGLPTLAATLRRAGFATGATVNNIYLRSDFGMARGFEEYDWRSGTDSTARPAEVSVDLALDWLDRHEGRPRFLMLHLMEPHFSYDAPGGFRGRFRTPEQMERFEVPAADGSQIGDRADELTPSEWDLIRAAYDEEIAYTDQQLARFFAGLQERGLWSESLVIFTSDHGEEFFDHGDYGHGHSMYQELLHVPLIVWGPGVEPARHRTPVSLVDLMPTILEGVGLDGPGNRIERLELDGESLWPLLRGVGLFGVPEALERRRLVAEHNQDKDPELEALVEWPWKLVSAPGAGPVALYHLADDPAETSDLGSFQGELAAELEGRLRAVVSSSIRERLVDRPVRLDEDDLRRLRALGYVE